MPNPQRSNTGSSTHLSPTSASAAQPSWPAPRSPLPPHRLAKLANALGVSTPVPATHGTHSFTLAPTSPTIPNSSTSSTFPDALRRSPTPSFASSQLQHTTAPSTSKFLLHVIPPYQLPHDTDDLDLTPPPPSASGYHTQFRRGVMVPVYPTLQAQLGAIAREYSLPSTVGMILYLITSLAPSAADEPGPRISEEIWKHIWARVSKTEKDEAAVPGPKPFGLGFGVAGRSSPALLQDLAANQAQSQSLRALISPRRVDTPQPMLSPSPSTYSSSASISEREAESPESATSVDPSSHSNSLPLPGLESPSLIPILAKVEFDIDKRKAGWYDPWLRSRRMNHAKRAESRMGGRSASCLGEESENEGVGEEVRRGPIDLALVDKMERRKNVPEFLLTTEPTEEPEDHEHDEYRQLEEDDDGDEELTARLNGLGEEGDPLRDVFGEDAETWAEMRTSGQTKRQTNSNVVELALDAEAVSKLPDDLEESDEGRLPETDEQDEISDLLKRMSKPALSVSIPSSPPALNKRRSSPTTAGTIKRHVPPPLNLMPSMPGNGDLPVPEPSPMAPSSAASVKLAYLQGGATPLQPEHTISHEENEENEEHEEEESEIMTEEDLLRKARSPEVEKRDGAFFDDLDLGLDPSLTESSEFDETDPFDHRRSQLFMAAQLDEIEKNLAQFSPRQLKSEDLTTDEANHRRMQSVASVRSLRNSSIRTLSPRNPIGELSPPSKASTVGTSWPAVPYSMVNGNEEDEDAPPSPPKFAFNGISTEPPKSPYQKGRSRSGTISDETLARQRALAEDQGLYPPLSTPSLTTTRNADSPVIPLSPDPFGRYPSTPEVPHLDERQSQHFPNEHLSHQAATLGVPPGRSSSRASGSLGAPTLQSIDEGLPPSHKPSSRFSLDSVTSEEETKAVKQPSSSSSLMSVKSIRRLWRKSKDRVSLSTLAPPESGRTSPNVPSSGSDTQPVGRPRTKSISRPPPPPPLASGPPIDPLRIPMARDNLIRGLRFDQESPYPIHPVRNSAPRSPSPPPPMPSRPPSQQQYRPPSVNQDAPLSAPPEKTSVRKSILKSWKSATGLSNGKTPQSRPNSTTPRSSVEQLPETAKKRRPSVLDLATGGLRTSVSHSSMSSATLVEIPPSPALPEQYANSARSSSRQSQNTHAGRPSVSSSGSTPSSPPRMRSPLVSTSPPGAGLRPSNARPSFESYDSRSSFDVSQFEMVSPPKGTLSYPYHGLDQSVLSQE